MAELEMILIIGHVKKGRFKKMKKRNKKKGFSIIELIVVMGIILLLASLTAGGFGMAKEYARRKRAETEIYSISVALGAYDMDYGMYPANLNLLTSTVKNGPYVDPSSFTGNDPWGTAYDYSITPPLNKPYSFDLYSWGHDKADDSGADDDITNW